MNPDENGYVFRGRILVDVHEEAVLRVDGLIWTIDSGWSDTLRKGKLGISYRKRTAEHLRLALPEDTEADIPLHSERPCWTRLGEVAQRATCSDPPYLRHSERRERHPGPKSRCGAPGMSRTARKRQELATSQSVAWRRPSQPRLRLQERTWPTWPCACWGLWTSAIIFRAGRACCYSRCCVGGIADPPHRLPARGLPSTISGAMSHVT